MKKAFFFPLLPVAILATLPVGQDNNSAAPLYPDLILNLRVVQSGSDISGTI